MEMEISKREKAIAKFNKATHRYIWHVSNSGYSLQEAVKKYNAAAKRFAKLNKGGDF